MKLKGGGKLQGISHFRRVLRFTDFEIWDLKLEESNYRICIKDQKRRATIADFELPPESQLDADELRENLITVEVFSGIQVKDQHIELLNQFAKQLTDHVALAYCHVITTFYQEKIDHI